MNGWATAWLTGRTDWVNVCRLAKRILFLSLVHTNPSLSSFLLRQATFKRQIMSLHLCLNLNLLSYFLHPTAWETDISGFFFFSVCSIKHLFNFTLISLMICLIMFCCCNNEKNSPGNHELWEQEREREMSKMLGEKRKAWSENRRDDSKREMRWSWNLIKWN